MMYQIKYDIIKEELLPAGWDDKKKKFSKKRTKMLTLSNGRIVYPLCARCKEASDD